MSCAKTQNTFCVKHAQGAGGTEGFVDVHALVPQGGKQLSCWQQVLRQPAEVQYAFV